MNDPAKRWRAAALAAAGLLPMAASGTPDLREVASAWQKQSSLAVAKDHHGSTPSVRTDRGVGWFTIHGTSSAFIP